MMQFPRDRTIPLTIAALSLGAALQVRDGLYSPIAITLLGVAVISTLVGLWSGEESSPASFYVLVAAVLVQFGLLFTDFPGSHHEIHAWRGYRTFLGLTAVAVGLVITFTRIDRWHVAFGTSLIYVYFAAAFWLLWKTPSPFMDVFVFQRDACIAMINGINPYTMTYPDLYGPAGAFVYGPNLSSNGRLLFGFPYMPLTLWFDLLGHELGRALGLDYRLINLMASSWAALCIAAMRPTRNAVLAMTLLLFTPRGFFVIEQGWTEPLAVMLLAMTVVCIRRFPRSLPYVFGLLLASKQYMVLLIPLLPLLTDWRDWRFHLKALATAAIVTLPLALWDIRAFWNNAVMLQFRQPFRDDALSFAALLARAGLPRLPTLVPLIAAIAVALICVKRFERSAHGFALGFALTFLTFFALNKQAFANYYYLVIAALCCAIATAAQSGTPRRAASERS